MQHRYTIKVDDQPAETIRDDHSDPWQVAARLGDNYPGAHIRVWCGAGADTSSEPAAEYRR